MDGRQQVEMNDDKTELIAIGTRSKICHSLPSVSIWYDTQFSQSAKNHHMDAHIKHLCCIFSVSCAEFEKSAPSCPLMRVVSLIPSRLEYCNSLPAGFPGKQSNKHKQNKTKKNKLQRMQNHAARFVLCKLRHVSAISLLRTLHCLPG